MDLHDGKWELSEVRGGDAAHQEEACRIYIKFQVFIV